MNRREAELAQREARRAKIIAGECPKCGFELKAREDMTNRSETMAYWACQKCSTTFGINKPNTAKVTLGMGR